MAGSAVLRRRDALAQGGGRGVEVGGEALGALGLRADDAGGGLGLLSRAALELELAGQAGRVAVELGDARAERAAGRLERLLGRRSGGALAVELLVERRAGDSLGVAQRLGGRERARRAVSSSRRPARTSAAVWACTRHSRAPPRARAAAANAPRARAVWRAAAPAAPRRWARSGPARRCGERVALRAQRCQPALQLAPPELERLDRPQRLRGQARLLARLGLRAAGAPVGQHGAIDHLAAGTVLGRPFGGVW